MRATLLAMGALGVAAAMPAASADPLGLVRVTLAAPAEAACDATFPVTGTVSLADAVPLADLSVRFVIDGVDVGNATTDADGAYAAEIAYADPGDFEIEAIVLPSPLSSTAVAPITIEGTYVYDDEDADGFGGNRHCTTTVPPDAVLVGGDCDETDPAVNPGAEEIPGNNIDENCNKSFVD